jgi:hypothetical protein
LIANRCFELGAGFMQSFLQLLSSDPAWIRTGLRVVHFCGLVLGVGAATLLDLIITRFILMRGISYEHVYVVDFSSRCRPECGWNLVGAFSGHMKVSFQAARSIG